MKHITAHPHLSSLVALLCMDGLFFGLTDPKRVPSWLLMIGFLLAIGTIHQVVKGLLVVLSWYGLPTGRHRQRLTWSLTIVMAVFMALESVGELGSRDVVVLVPLIWLGYLYFSYSRRLRPAEANV